MIKEILWNRCFGNRGFWKWVGICALIGFVGGAVVAHMAKQVIEKDQLVSKINAEFRRTVSDKVNQISKESFIVSTMGKDNRIMRFTLVDENDDPEIMLDLIEESLINKLVEVGFWELQITSKSHTEIIVIDLHDKTVKKKKLV